MAIRAHGICRLYSNDVGETALSPVDAPSVCVGVDALGNYFADSLFKEGMSIRWAKVVAAHLVWNCKEYVRGYCGGQTHLIALPHTGKPVMIDGGSEVWELEQHLAGLGSAYQAVLPVGSPLESASEDTLRLRAQAITKAIHDAQISFYLMAEPGRVDVSGKAPTVRIEPASKMASEEADDVLD